MVDDASPPRPALASVRELGRTVLDMLHTRLELLTVELGQERDRLAELLLYGALLVLLVLLTLVLGAMLMVALFWDTPQRLPVIATMAALPAIAALACAGALVHQLRSRPRPFDASLLALGADLAALK
jgi:uncharacterized membrane protein YqjE